MESDLESSTPPVQSKVTDGLLSGNTRQQRCACITQHKKRSLLLSLVLLGVVFTICASLIATRASSSSSGSDPQPSKSTRLFTFQDQFNRSLAPKFASVRWLSASVNLTLLNPILKQQFVVNHAYDINTTNVNTNTDVLEGYTTTQSSNVLTVLLYPNGTRLELTLYNATQAPIIDGSKFTYQDYYVSGDLSYILFNNHKQKVYRHSFLASYYLYSTVSRTLVPVAGGQPLQLAELGPVPTPQQSIYTPPQLVYVLDIDIYLLNIPTNTTVQITHDGSPNDALYGSSRSLLWANAGLHASTSGRQSSGFGGEILNGICDWAYEEEVFSQSSAIWWSGDASSLIYIKFKQNGVASFLLTEFVSPLNTYSTFAYPQPGLNRSTVSLHIYSIPSTTTWDVPGLPLESIDYITDIAYLNQTWIAIRSMNGGQNVSTLVAADLTTNSTRTLHVQSHHQYLETMQVITPIIDGTQQLMYVDLMVNLDWQHIALFSVTGIFQRWLTSGAWGVDSILAYRASTQILYYISTEPGSTQRAVYGVSMNGTRYDVGISASVARAGDASVLHYQTASFSPDATYFVLNEQGDVPASTLHYIPQDTTDYTNTTRLALLSDNTGVFSLLSEYSLPTRTLLSVPSSDPSQMLNAMMLRPADFDVNHKYPVLIQVYGGPGAQQVTSKYCCSSSLGFHTYLASTHKMIIFVVDPIGTGARGDAWQKATTYLNLGVHEAEDVIASIAWLASQSYVDSSKIAIWGWSYGGYLTSMIATSENNHLRAIMSIAPVTDWRLYDSIYTERYMRNPQNNPSGYNTSSVLHRVRDERKFPSAGYLLIHGTADDNVHFQHSALLLSSLQLLAPENPFSTMVYPNRDHSLAGPNGEDNPHLYRLLTQHLITQLNLPTTLL